MAPILCWAGPELELHDRASARRHGRDVNAWWTAIDSLPDIINRLRRIQIICQPAEAAIPRFDQPKGLIYRDPPYAHGTRSKRSISIDGVEMADDEHWELANVLLTCKAKVVLSGYRSALYARDRSGWSMSSPDGPEWDRGEFPAIWTTIGVTSAISSTADCGARIERPAGLGLS